MYLHVHLIHTYVATEDLKPFDSIFKIWIQFFFPLLGYTLMSSIEIIRI